MAELVLLELSRSEVLAAARRVTRGEATSDDTFEHLFDSDADRDLACFVCDGVCDRRPFAVVVPDRGEMVAAPLCPTCSELPRMVRVARCQRLLRRMRMRR